MAVSESTAKSKEEVTPSKGKFKKNRKSPMHHTITKKLGKKIKQTKSKEDERTSRELEIHKASSFSDSEVPTEDELSAPGTPNLNILEIKDRSLLNDSGLTPETTTDTENPIPTTPPQIHRLNDIDGNKGSKIATVRKAEKSAKVGISFRSSRKSTDVVIASIAEDGLFADCVLKAGQKVFSINGHSCDSALSAATLVRDAVGELTIVTVDREEDETPLKDISATNLTLSFLESSFMGPDSANAMLEAAYLKAQKENNEILKQMKDMEERAAAEERKKVDKMLRATKEGSAFKWAKMAIEDAGEVINGQDSSMDESNIPPKEPAFTARKIDFEPKVEDSLDGEKTHTTQKKWNAYSAGIAILLTIIVLCFAAIHPSSKYRDSFDHALSATKTFISPRSTVAIAHLQKLHHEGSVFVKKESATVKQSLGSTKSRFDLHATIFEVFATIVKYRDVAFRKAKILLGLELDMDGEILPLAQHYTGVYSNEPLSGMNVVVNNAASGVGVELARTLTQLGATVVAVDRSAQKLNALRSLGASLATIEVDMEDLAAVSRSADEIVDRFGYVDLLFGFDGGYYRGLGETEQGFDQYFGAYYLSQYLFTTKLLEPIKRSSRGSIFQVSSIAYMLVDGSDLKIDSTNGQPRASLPRDVGSIRAFSNSVLAGILHNRYLSRTEQDLRVTTLFPQALTTSLRVRSVLYQVLQDSDEQVSPRPLLSTLLKQKLSTFSYFTASIDDEVLQNDLSEWSEKTVAQFWWMDLIPESREILREDGQEVIHPPEDESLYDGFFQGGVATLLSLSSYTIFRRFATAKLSNS
eukprot:scaffold991_cov128-Cylindrotheca_fusiformis.AAC.8